MQIIHGTWIPQHTEDYWQEGHFYLWIETDQVGSGRKQENVHPRSLKQGRLTTFLNDKLGIKKIDAFSTARNPIFETYFTLPTADGQPLKSYELMQFSNDNPPENFELRAWRVDSYRVSTPNIINLLKEIHFLFSDDWSAIQLGADLKFWYHYTQSLREFILKDRYVPALKYRAFSNVKGKQKKYQSEFEIHPIWEIIAEKYDSKIELYASKMPSICVAGAEKLLANASFFSKPNLLRHFSENVLNKIIQQTPSTQKFNNQIESTLLSDCIYYSPSNDKFIKNDERKRWQTETALALYKKWRLWNDKLHEHHSNAKFVCCFKLEAALTESDDWKIIFQLQSKADPSLKIDLNDYWSMNKTAQKRVQKGFGADLEKNILLNLGQAAKMYPKIWEGMETETPTEIRLKTEEAFSFLKENAWVLQAADYKVIVPAWWMPEGRRKAKIRLKTSSKKTKGSGSSGKSFFGKDTILQYQYELSIGGEVVNQNEWNELVNAKSSLVKFRGEWMELDQGRMKQMLEFWQNHGDEKPEINALDLMKMSANEEEFEFDHDDALKEMMPKLWDKSQFEVIPNPEKLNGQLREYQKRGVSWLSYLEKFGLNGCLADDMGLGKTIQVIAQLINEREEKEKVLPTLLIVPTSVIGNWNREIDKFAPHLTVWIHHGSDRLKNKKEFTKTVLTHDTVITSYALARRDINLFQAIEWERIVLDEAQNIKNPKAAQTKAILKINAKYRLALTGTPVENRLMDLWSIFNFLNPGYLETQTSFRKTFELPIQKENDILKTKVLKSMIEPFILRRVKTDKNIIKDLPDKVEQKVYCTLSQEQASLYEAVVKDVLLQIAESEGIQRKGLMLSSLLRLKQICNHPAQFLQDNSEFTKERSFKLSRLIEMVQEAIESGESLLIFTQFKEICESLNRFIQNELHYKTFLLHGSTPRKKREKMILEFQDPATKPAVFILSIKAGGVGITLTKANHVFHFDRWWNPAVEDQATDRAFRIGQQKNVFVHKFVSMGTLEERIDLMLEEKKKIAGAIIGSDESWLKDLDNESFKKLISLNKNAVWA